MVEIILFWFSILLLFHSYVLFPQVLYLLKQRRRNNEMVFHQGGSLPFVSVILSVYNEENVIKQRVCNIFGSDYPADKLEILVGSDGSTDRTSSVLRELQSSYPALQVVLFPNRRGKGNVLNDLRERAKGDILVLTDAKVQFSPHVIFQMVKHFYNPEIGIVGGNITNHHTRKDGVSVQESRFMSREMMMKYNEGRLWGTAIGVYGACYAIRRKLFREVPRNFAVEDFYMTFKALEIGHKAIMELNAVCYEDVPNRLEEEFRRKVRISSGNFQNMKTFSHLLLKPDALGFCFFSHKVIRWIGPFLLMIIFFSNILLLQRSVFYVTTFILQFSLFFIPVFDFFLRKIHIHIITLRFITHFYSMNLALLFGFIKYLKGVKTNVWEPTERTFR
jgi:cellulose synthase/poly-beta-1,6-N-acetylglucosamine synthase-like glycosyltransferase